MKHPIATMAFVFGAGFIVAGAMSSARADDDPPHRKPGMWQQAMTMGGGQTMTMQMCIDEATEKQFSAMGRNRAGCSQEFHKVPGGYSFKGTCDGKTATGTAIGDFDKAIKVEVDSEGAHMVSNLTYLGPCPADRKPGDIVMPGGQVMNMKDMPK
ncbi:Protein of unknown function [Enhydrobacter aerosaccus]|uniref:DUF3617 family protein n=1 Tax=Enhydrobacter aerosaccus TaxID=225324 RepID=A0A1T4P303_9HYPH|nr:DUF3617 family protein [Enhydrobacter aerosaccus]SJZ85905.1 Protein of unknown function [Enhydrobacter aerosaccus]